MDPNDTQRLLALAKRIARDAPAKPHKYVLRAGIQWTLILELRDLLKEIA